MARSGEEYSGTACGTPVSVPPVSFLAAPGDDGKDRCDCDGSGSDAGCCCGCCCCCCGCCDCCCCCCTCADDHEKGIADSLLPDAIDDSRHLASYSCRSSCSSMWLRRICISRNCWSWRTYSTLFRKMMPLLGFACAAASAGLFASTGDNAAAKLVNEGMFKHDSLGMPRLWFNAGS